MEKSFYKYNMTLYYQSTVIYFIAMLGYVLLRAQFAGLDFENFTHDPISYLFIIVIGYSILGTTFNLIRNKRIGFFDKGFLIETRFDKKVFNLDEIKSIIIRREHRFHFQGAFRTVKIRTLKRVYPLYIRPFDYDDENQLLEEFRQLREKLYAKQPEDSDNV
ncbi:MAG: hypothetical protein FJ213_03135 [Ignavibacteria bacterium]|nr:hypothetical protein [Ignavibacteria bacterium]